MKTWLKSNYSGPNGNCVEVSSELSKIRDSKNPDGPHLSGNIPALIRAVKKDRFQRHLS